MRDKADYFEKTNLIPTLDASATVVKSDTLIPDNLRYALKQAFKRLKDDQADSPDWHPGSGDMVQDLVHPSMCPLIYGQSKVLREEVVGVDDAVEKWAGKGDTIPKKNRYVAGKYDYLVNRNVPLSYWSENYQWLPSNVVLHDDGSVQFTSYINNLHPNRYPEIYQAIENLIQLAIPAWDQVLVTCSTLGRRGPGRTVSRFSIPNDADDENNENWTPSDPQEVANADVVLSDDEAWFGDDGVEVEDDEDAASEDSYSSSMYAEEHGGLSRLERVWQLLRKPVLRDPEPYEALNYDPYRDVGDTKDNCGGLFKKFRESGLQVIVKMASIELTPEKPEFPVGGWHVSEGLTQGLPTSSWLGNTDHKYLRSRGFSMR